MSAWRFEVVADTFLTTVNDRVSKYVKGSKYTVTDNAIDKDLKVKAKQWLAEGKIRIWAPESPQPTVTAKLEVDQN